MGVDQIHEGVYLLVDAALGLLIVAKKFFLFFVVMA